MEGDYMNLEEKKDNELWYDNPSIVTWLIILIISIIQLIVMLIL